MDANKKNNARDAKEKKTEEEPLEFDFDPKLTKKQSVAWDALDRNEIREVLYGGAKGGGKSVFGCMWSFRRAIDIIKECNISRRKHPIPVGFMGRKRGVDFTNTTLETWKRFIPEHMYEIKGKPAEIIIADRVKILTGGLDNSDIINKFNSAEYAFFFLDQAEEIDAAQIGELRATFRLIINGKKIPGKGLFTANPAPSFLKDEFILNPTPDRLFIQALPTDNSHLGPEYIEVLKDSFKNRPELLKAYLEGSWDSLGGFNQVIKDSWVRNAAGITLYPARIKKLITCDPARYGDDETVIYYMKNTEIAEAIVYGQKSLMHTANVLHILAHKHGDCLIAVDVCGLGAGLVDRLIEMGDNVLAIDNASKSVGKVQCPANRGGCLMVSLLAKIARAAGVVLLAVLAVWFSPLLLMEKLQSLRTHPESSDPEYLYYKRQKLERKKRWLFYRQFDRWEQKQKKTRFKRIEKKRKDFFN